MDQHRCKYPELCSTRGLFVSNCSDHPRRGMPFCYKHKKQCLECSFPTAAPYLDFCAKCADNICKTPCCRNMRIENSSFCSEHACFKCMEKLRAKGSDYCDLCKCSECKKEALANQRCEDHTCGYCGVPVNPVLIRPGFNICDQCKCSIKNCYSRRVNSLTCADHACFLCLPFYNGSDKDQHQRHFGDSNDLWGNTKKIHIWLGGVWFKARAAPKQVSFKDMCPREFDRCRAKEDGWNVSEKCLEAVHEHSEKICYECALKNQCKVTYCCKKKSSPSARFCEAHNMKKTCICGTEFIGNDQDWFFVCSSSCQNKVVRCRGKCGNLFYKASNSFRYQYKNYLFECISCIQFHKKLPLSVIMTKWRMCYASFWKKYVLDILREYPLARQFTEQELSDMGAFVYCGVQPKFFRHFFRNELARPNPEAYSDSTIGLFLRCSNLPWDVFHLILGFLE